MDQMSDAVDNITKVLLVVILSVMALVVFAQVLFRYALQLPLFWTEEFARYCLVWASLLGAGIAFKRGEHIAVTYLTDRFLPGRKSLVTSFMVDILVLTILVIILLGGISLVMMTVSQISPALRIPMAIPYMAIPIGSAIMIIHQLAAFYKRLRISGLIKTSFKLKLVTITPESHAYNVGAREFARLVGERSKGTISIDVLSDGDGHSGEEEIVKAVQMGTIDLAVISTGPLAMFSPEIGLTDLPYLFNDHNHVDKVMDGSIGDGLLASLDQVKGLSFMENGFRHFTSSKHPIVELEDCVGLKIRTMDNPVHMMAVRDLGAEAVAMKWGEKVLDDLKSEALDGQENPISIVHANRMNETQKYLSLTQHFYSSAPLCMNKNNFHALLPQWQEIFLESAKEAAVFERDFARQAEKKHLEELESKGMDIRTVNLDSFINSMESVQDFFLGKYPIWKETVQRIKNA